MLSANNVDNRFASFYKDTDNCKYYQRYRWMSYEHVLDQWIDSSSYPLITGISYPHPM